MSVNNVTKMTYASGYCKVRGKLSLCLNKYGAMKTCLLLN